MTTVQTPDQWLAAIDDVALVDRRIQELQAERAEAKALANPTHSDEDAQKARDLATQLEMAIRNGDLETLDALELAYGHVQSIAIAKNLVQERQKLMKQKQQLELYTELRRDLSQVVEYDFEQVKSLKERIYGISDLTHQDQLFQTLDNIVSAVKEKFIAQLTEQLHESKWTTVATPTDSLREAFTQLVNLQSLTRTEPHYPEPLWAFTAVANAFTIKFQYHFHSAQETNRIDRPDLFLSFFVKYLQENIMRINRFFSLQGTDLDDRFAHSEFITAALVPVREKLVGYIRVLRRSLNDVVDDVDLRLLINLIREVVQFDETVITEFYYDPLNDGLWPGLFACFDYSDLEKWLNLEIRLSMQNFESIVNANDVFQIDYTSVAHDELKPTVSALRLKKMYQTTTATFAKLFKPNYENNAALQKFKLKLFSNIYLKVLELYYQRLEDGCVAFAELFRKTKTLLQPTKGAEIDISGVNGLERLFRLYCSLKHTTQSLNVWNHELIFVEVNQLYNRYAHTQSTSLFSGMLADYEDLQGKVFSLILKFFGKTIESLMKNYNNLNTWNRSAHIETFTLSTELVPLIDKVQELLLFSQKVVSARDYTLIKNQVSYEIAEYLLQYIIKGNHFNHQGVKQISLDFTTVWEKLSLKRNFPLYHSLVEAFQILNLTDDQVSSWGGYGTLAQYARAGDYAQLREFMALRHLKDGELLDIMLRVHT